MLVELGSALIGGLAGGTIAAIIGAYVTLRQQARQHAHELRMSREARFADRIRELAAKLIVLAERYPPAVREQLSRRRWDTGRLPLPDADNSFFGVARELPLLLRSQPALDALAAFVAAVARVESFLVWTDQAGAYTVAPEPTDDDLREADRAIALYRDASDTFECAIRSELGVDRRELEPAPSGRR